MRRFRRSTATGFGGARPGHCLPAGWLAGVLLLLGLLGLGAAPALAQPAAGHVIVVQVHDVIDLGLAPYLERVLEQAEREQASAVVLEINTPGGRVDAALQIRDALLGSPVRTVAFVNREAFSAGALIALAANEIYLTPGAVMGAATPVDASGVPVDQKTISAIRKTFKATAELRGRDPRVAEAMVDPAVEVPNLVAPGELLTLTTSEAVAWGYADGVVPDRQALLRELELASAAVQQIEPSPAEVVVRFLTNPVIASLLFAGGLLCLFASLFTGEVGLLTAIGVGLLAAFFWGHVLVGLAGWEGVALVVLGLLLLAVEVLLIPGFGLAGILGLAALLGGLYLSVTSQEVVTPADLERALFTIASTFVILVAGGALLLRLMPAVGRRQGLVLLTALGRSAEAASRGTELAGARPVDAAAQPSLVGARGRALSDLRPAGFAEFDGQRVDVISQGDFIPAGAAVEVIRDEGYRRVVRRLAPRPDTVNGRREHEHRQ